MIIMNEIATLSPLVYKNPRLETGRFSWAFDILKKTNRGQVPSSEKNEA